MMMKTDINFSNYINDSPGLRPQYRQDAILQTLHFQ